MISSPYFSPAFIQQLMRDYTPNKDIIVSSVTMIDVDNSASILAALASAQTDMLIGHFGLQVTFSVEGHRQTRQMVMKIKPHGLQIVNMLNTLAQACGGQLAIEYEAFKNVTGFQHTHCREQEIYNKLRPSFTPEIFGLYTNDVTQEYIILMEYLKDVALLNSVMAPAEWKDEHIKQALMQMAQWHSSQLNKPLHLDMCLWDDAPSLEYMTNLIPLWEALLYNAAEKFPELYNASRVKKLQNAISSIDDNWRYLQLLPKTLVHNDFNPRNSCFKKVDGHLQFCLYDWELATFHIPQYDVVEFLCFVLDEDRYDTRPYYIEFYRQQLHEATGKYDATAFNYEFHLAALDFGIHRLGMYIMAHAINAYPFIPRVVNSFFNTIELLDIK